MGNGTVVLTKNELVQILYDIAKAHYQIKGFGYGNIDEISVATQTAYSANNDEFPKSSNADRCPLMWVTPIRMLLRGKELFYNFDVIIADLVKKEGNINLQDLEVESDTMLICLDICSMLDNQYEDFHNDRNTTIDPFNERGNDDYTGHIATISLKAPFNYNRCQVPTEPTT